MSRIVKNKPKTIECKLCFQEFSLYAIAAHLRYKHDMSADEYESKYEKFRKEKSDKKRKINKVVCQLCKNEYASVGFFTHLRDSHQLTIDRYAERFGEFRKNIAKKNNIVRTQSCDLCHVENLSLKGLGAHVKKEHALTFQQYIIQTKFNGHQPVCACGCGQKLIVKHLTSNPKFISGHNTKGKLNPMYGKRMSRSSLEKMKDAGRKRVELYRKNNIPLAYHRKYAIEKRAKIQTDKFISRIQTEYDVSILDRTSNQKLLHFIVQCNKCNEIFDQYHQAYFLCPKCSPRYRSKIEQEIIDHIKSIDNRVNIQHNCRSILTSGKELDIYFPDYKFAIEFNGLYWHGELNGGKHRTYHLDKTNECHSLGIELFHIFEDEWINYRDVVLGKIEQRLKLNTFTTIYARNCTIVEVDASVAREFLNKYHLQGADNSRIRIGLFANDELISIMTFSKPNASRSAKKSIDKTYELSRFCTKSQTTVVGGASKLLKYFVRSYTPTKIISYADRRYTSDSTNVYNSIGFSLVNKTGPGYWYFKSSEKRFHRFNFTKKKTVQLGGDPNKTEWENMVNMGYDRIWDCGHLKYEWNVI